MDAELLKECLTRSFKNELYQVVTFFGKDPFGRKVAESILQETQRVYEEIRKIRGNDNFVTLLKEKYSSTRVFPKEYTNNGCANCDNLFFEYRFEPHGVYVGIGFYLPSLFSSEKQKEELAIFTNRCKEKVANPMSIEFYFVVAESPEII